MSVLLVLPLQYDSLQNWWFPELLHFGNTNFCFSNCVAKHPRDFWKFRNCPHVTRAISMFLKMHLENLSQIAFPKIWLLVPTDRIS